MLLWNYNKNEVVHSISASSVDYKSRKYSNLAMINILPHVTLKIASFVNKLLVKHTKLLHRRSLVRCRVIVIITAYNFFGGVMVFNSALVIIATNFVCRICWLAG